MLDTGMQQAAMMAPSLLLGVLLTAACQVVSSTRGLLERTTWTDETGTFWKDSVATSTEPLFSVRDVRDFEQKARTARVVALEGGCGREMNRMAVLEDGTRLCCRYRKDELLLRGEIFSFHFNNLLRMHNSPLSMLLKVDFASDQWRGVAEQAQEAGWEDGNFVVATAYINDLQKESIPVLLQPDAGLLTSERVANVSAKDARRLAQWTDMIIFDFVIGHTDRLYNAMYNLRWNPHVLSHPVHNLGRTADGKLVLLDNESGFWLGYASARIDHNNSKIQEMFLHKVCIFHRDTMSMISELYSSEDPSKLIEDYIQLHDPQALKVFRKLSQSERKDVKLRISKVHNRLIECGHSTDR